MFGLNNKINGGDPRTHRQETGGARRHSMIFKSSGQASGLVAGTMVATGMGWRAVETIAEGDMVLTFDRGLRPVRSVKRGKHWDGEHACPVSLRPFRVPAGALGNVEPMWLLPEQCVMVENETADLLYDDDPFTLLHAAHLAGFRGIEQVQPPANLDVIHLEFDEDEVIYASAGALVFCPSLRVLNITELMDTRTDQPLYKPLPADDARMLVKCLKEEDFLDGGWAPPTDRPGAAYAAACA